MTPDERGAGLETLDRVRSRLVAEGRPPTTAAVASAVRAEGGSVLGDDAVLAAAQEVHAELVGVGVLEPLLHDPLVTDVLVNGPDEVWSDRGSGLERVPIRFRDDAAVRRLAQRLAAMAGRRLDAAAPYADARLPGGVRFHAVLAPVASSGTCISLRVPPRRAFTIDDLATAGSIGREVAQVLVALVRSNRSFLVTGGTGAGKTTLLTTLLGLVDARERMVLVEDTGELVPNHPHVVRLEARPPNVEGSGAITLRDLVRQSLRMRPDRLVVGEVRGAEVVDLLAALNTGHSGGCGTLHANAASEAPARLEALALAAGLPRAALHSQVAAGLEVVVHVERVPGGPRRVAEVCHIQRGPDGLVAAVPALRTSADGLVVEGPAAGALLAAVGLS